jgi:uncharacterized protein YfdQ (DUF2303 family)
MTDTDNLVSAAAELAYRDADRSLRTSTVEQDTAFVIARLRNDERVEERSLERHLGTPRRNRGTANVHDPNDFAEYINRLADDATTTVWADPDGGKLVAVFDDHVDATLPGWRSHTATLTLKADPDWQKWLACHNKLGGQADFAEQLEDLAHTVVDPDAATMLEIARTFDAKRSVNFNSGVRLDSGDVQLTFEETTNARAGEKGRLDVPAAFVISISPFLGVPPAEVQARLRWRIVNRALAIGYALLRPDRVRREIIAGLVGQLRSEIDPVPVFLGFPPPPVEPQ